MRAIAEEAGALVRKYKGAFSGEHGDGLCRGEWIAWQFGPALNEAFRAIKQEMDPIGLFNPGRIIDPPRMDDTSLFRFPPPDAAQPYTVQPLKPALDWSDWDVQNDPVTEKTSPPGSGGDPAQGFAKAVEMCNNNGHCRKFDAGTMCPSYRVTRDEQHLTRGRANTLRLALSGQLGPDALTGKAHVRDHGALRLLQGLQARMSHRRRHGADEGGISPCLQGAAWLHAAGPAGGASARLCRRRQPHGLAAQSARPPAGPGLAERKAGWPVGPARAAEMAPRHILEIA